MRAGYSAKCAAVQGCRLLRNAQIADAIAAKHAARATKAGITQDRVEQELALLAFSDVTHYEVDDDGDVTLAAGAPTGAMRALSSIKRRIVTRGSGKTKEVTREVELKLWDKPGPLELAGQHVGMFSKLGDKERPFHGVTTVKFGGRYKPPAEATT